ncbi:MAG: ATP-binding protein [Bacteroidales bacterium]|nr:ATP-binding protein [Bacteroidales bacterium]
MDKPLTETNRIEFKRELNDDLDLEKEVVAFLNYREGGIIYVGIDKFGNPIGVDDLDGDMLKICVALWKATTVPVLYSWSISLE